jgi:high-affinity nickel permease
MMGVMKKGQKIKGVGSMFSLNHSGIIFLTMQQQ